jgi:uncharacterized protein YcaQ
MSVKPPREASAAELRRFLLGRLGLSGGYWNAAEAEAEAIRLGMWQMDSIRVSGLRNQELAWAARSDTPPRGFYDLLYGSHALVETHYPVFATRRDWLPSLSLAIADPAVLRKPLGKRIRRVMQEVEEHIRLNGPTGPGAFTSRRVVGGFNTVKETTRALELLWSQRRLVIAGRDRNFQRLFDLAERRTPELAGHVMPPRADYERFLIRAAFGVLKTATAEQIAERVHLLYGSWRPGGGIKHWRAAVGRMIEAGEAEAVRVPDLEGAPLYWHLPEEAVGWERGAAGREDPVRLIPPLDHLLYSRSRFTALFGRAFKFEAYTPKRHRRFYFALPILAEGEMVGQLDAKLDGRRWRIRGLELTQPVELDRLREAVHRLARIAGAEAVSVPARVEARVKDALRGKIA